jgi:hypothetical protein
MMRRASLLALLCGTSHAAKTWSEAQGGKPWAGEAGVGRPWKPIATVDDAKLEVSEFSERYMEKHEPLIFQGYTSASRRPKLHRWTLQRLKERCGSFKVRFSDRHLAFLQSSSAEETEAARARLADIEGVSLDEAIALLKREMSLSEYIDYVVAESAKPRNPRKDYSHMADYILPLKIKEMPLQAACQEMYDDLVVPKYFSGRKLNPPPEQDAAESGGRSDRCAYPSLHPQPILYIAPAYSRAYPVHVHGKMDENMLLLLDGTKHFVHWYYDQRMALRKLVTQAKTDSGPIGDEIYMAEGINYDFGAQPTVAGTEGWEAFMRRGDMLYLPCGSAHQVENMEATLAVRISGMSIHALKCMKYMYEEGWGGVDANWMENYFNLLVSIDVKVPEPVDQTVDEYCGFVPDGGVADGKYAHMVFTPEGEEKDTEEHGEGEEDGEDDERHDERHDEM